MNRDSVSRALRSSRLRTFVKYHVVGVLLGLTYVAARGLAEQHAEEECIEWCRASDYDFGLWRPHQGCRCVFPTDHRSWEQIQRQATERLIEAVECGEVQP